MSGGAILVSSLLSFLWIAVAIQDMRAGKMDNVATVGAFALAFGYRVGEGADGGSSELLDYVIALGIADLVALVA